MLFIPEEQKTSSFPKKFLQYDIFLLHMQDQFIDYEEKGKLGREYITIHGNKLSEENGSNKFRLCDDTGREVGISYVPLDQRPNKNRCYGYIEQGVCYDKDLVKREVLPTEGADASCEPGLENWEIRKDSEDHDGHQQNNHIPMQTSLK
ncbi:hypothetical protein NE237_023355 [Protea cynaroides]|uniref:Uncharacterized protein n=1 Tax=Protea cynaroides TaxID=273540 RepID=A0A9Q0HDT3_9MAGN|nr:hypothetical protein NE237_023355 [Protea cynaroides]